MPTLTERERVRQVLYQKGITNWSNSDIDSFIDNNRDKIAPVTSGTQIASPTAPTPTTTPNMLSPSRALRQQAPVDRELPLGALASEVDAFAESGRRSKDRNAMLDLVGNTVWSGLDSFSFGALGLLDADYTIEDALTGGGPSTTAGSLGAGLGSLVGFLTGPIQAAKGVGRLATQRLLKGGTQKAAEKLIYTSGKSNKAFKTLADKSKSWRNLSDEGKDRFFKPWTEQITKEIPKLRTNVQRDAFAKNFKPATEAALKQKLNEIGVRNIGKDTISAIADDIVETVGIKAGKALPAHDLERLIAGRLTKYGLGGKTAEVAAVMLEEGVVLAAAESIPHAIHNLRENKEWHEGMGGTLAHAFALGNIFGSITQFVPGGKDVPILKTAAKRLRDTISKKKPYSAYNLTKESDRELLAGWAHSLWRASERNKQGAKIFTDLGLKLNGKPISRASDIRKLIDDGLNGKGTEADKIAGAKSVRDFLQRVENNWNKNWWGLFLREAKEDLWGSTPRMAMGAMAMNWDPQAPWGFMPLRNDIPLADKAFHIAVGAFMSKRGREVQYLDKSGKRQTIEWTKRAPLGDDYIRASQFMDMLGMDNDQLIFSGILQDSYLRSKFMKVDGEHADIVELKRILEDEGVIVDESHEFKGTPDDVKTEQSIINRIVNKRISPDGLTTFDTNDATTAFIQSAEGKRQIREKLFKIKSNRGKGIEGHHDVYEQLEMVSHLLLNSGERMLGVSELSPSALYKIEKKLRDGTYESINKLETISDVDDIMLSANDVKMTELLDTLENSVSEVYRALTDQDPNQAGISGDMLRFLDLRIDNIESRLTAEQQNILAEYERARDLLVQVGRAKVIDRDEKRYINEEQISRLVDSFNKVNDGLNKVVNKSENVSKENQVSLGDSWMLDLIEGQSFFKSYRNMYEMLNDSKNSKGAWKSNEKGENNSTAAHRLLSAMLKQSDGRLASTWEIQGGNEARNQKDLYMLKSLRRMMEKMDNHTPAIPVGIEGLIDTKPIKVSQDQLRTLKGYLSDNGMNIFSYGDDVRTETFVRAVEGFGIDKFIKKGTRVNKDGSVSTLTGADRAKVAYLLNEGIVDYSGNMLDLQIEDPFKAVIGTQFAKDLTELKRLQKGISKYVYGDFVGTNSKFNIEDMNQDLRDNIEKVLRDKGIASNNMNDEIAKFFADLVIKYQDHLQPFIKTTNGGMFTPVSGVQAVADYSNILELKLKLDSLEMLNNKFSHNQLLDAINDSMGSDGLSTDKKELLRSLYNKFYYGQSPSNNYIKLLNELGLYKDGKFDYTDDAAYREMSLQDRIKVAIREADLTIPGGSTEANINQRISELANRYDVSYETDTFKSMTENQFIEKYGISTSQMKVGLNFQGDDVIANLMENASLKDSDGKTVLYTEMSKEQKHKLLEDSINMMMTKYNGMSVKRLYADEQSGVFIEAENIVFKNPVMNFLKDIIGSDGEMTIIDPNVSTTNGPRNARSDSNAMMILTDKMTGKVEGHSPMKGLVQGDDGIPLGRLDSNYLPIFFGDVNFAIGVPYNDAFLNKISQQFGEYVQTIKSQYKDSKFNNIRTELNQFINLKLDPKTRKIKDEQGNDVEVKTYSFKKSSGDVDRHAVNLMLTHLFMNKSMGTDYWINKARLTDEDGLKFAKRIRMVLNPSAKKIDPFVLDSAIKGYQRFVDTNEMPEAQESLDALKALRSGIKYVHISDENILPGQFNVEKKKKKLNKLFSTFHKIEEQMRSEGFSEDDIKVWRDKIDRKDTSLADSYTAVSPRLWRALKALVGANNTTGIGGIKPVITRIGDKEGIMLGKTAFVPDKRMETFFKTNQDIDMVIMGSAEKTGNQKLNTIDANMLVDQNGDASWSALENFVVGDNFNRLDAEDINLASVVNSTKDGTVSYQVTNELSSSANNSFYNWLVRPQIETYIQDVPKFFNSRSPEDAIAYGKYKLNDDGGGLDGAYQKWLGLANGIPFTQAMLPTFKSQIKKSFIDDGIISLKTEFGNQSVLSPGLDVSDLRNSLFKDNEIFTIGQVEIAHTNRNKNVEFDRLHIIEHNAGGSGKDNILTWNEFKNKVRKERNIKDFKENAMPTLGKLFDTIEGLVNPKLDGKRYEIAVTGWRPPSAKPSDKVISGLKGFADASDGNQARLNVSDLMLRIEGDFDVDKYNYWWDTPEDVIKEWNGNSGKVLSTPSEIFQNKHTAKNFSWGNGEKIEGYNLNSSTASKLRGTVVKTKRIVQFLNHYTSHAEKGKGFSIMINGKLTGPRLVKFDETKMAEAEEIIARDIQNIVDSTTGYNNILYNQDWFEKFLFGSGDIKAMDNKTTWEGVFSIYKGKEVIKKDTKFDEKDFPQSKIDNVNLRDSNMRVARAMIMDVVGGYRRFLQLGSDVYEVGQGRKPNYDDILSYSTNYSRHMQNLNEYSRKRILKNRPENIDYRGWKKEVDQFFKDSNGNEVLPFGAFGANMDKVDKMLPFDRAMKEILETDAMALDSPSRMFGKSLNEFEKGFDEYIGSENKSQVIGDMINNIKSDVRKISFLNYLDFKIKKSSEAKYNALKDRRKSLADYHDDIVKESVEMKEQLESELMLDKKTGENIKKAAQRRIVSDVYKSLYFKGQRFANFDKVTGWLKSPIGKKAIREEVKRMPVRIKGINTHEYLDTVIWNEILGKFNDIYVDPSSLKGEGFKDFEKDLNELIKTKNDYWKNYFDDKKRGKRTKTYLDEDAIHSEITSLFNAKFDKWEERGNGLGRLLLFRFMAPKKSVGEYTYFNGKLVEGFKSTSASNIKFGLRWLADPQNHTTRIGEFEVDNMFKDMAAQYNNFFKMFHGQKMEGTTDDGFFNLERFESDVKRSLENTTVVESMPLKDVFGTVAGEGLAGEINPMLGSVFGYNDNQTVGYIMAHNPIGPESISKLKKAANQNFLPSAYVPKDFNGGSFNMINGWSSYNKARKDNARIFLGSAANKGALYYKKLPMQRVPFEESGTKLETASDLKDNVTTSILGGC